MTKSQSDFASRFRNFLSDQRDFVYSDNFKNIIRLSLLGFLIIASYSMARSAITSLFQTAYTSKGLPIVWLTTPVAVVIVLGIYNHYSARRPLLRLMSIAGAISCVLLAALLFGLQNDVYGMPFLMYIWMDVYIVVLVEIYWSFSDVIFTIQAARRGYGLLLALSTCGGIVGNKAIGPLAQAIGTVNALWCVVPFIIIISLMAMYLANKIGDHVPEKSKKKKANWTDSLTVVKNSKYLVPMMCLVALVQVVITLIDYQFNSSVEAAFPTDPDMRTAIFGNVHFWIDSIAIILQILTGPILKITGVAGTLALIPVCIGLALATFLKFPSLAMMEIVKITSKAFDYSIFRAAKEILYIPLTHEEKTQGKGVIDMLVYRTSKGLSSLILLGMTAIGMLGYTLHLTIGLEVIWIFLTYILIKRYRSIVPWEEEKAIHAER